MAIKAFFSSFPSKHFGQLAIKGKKGFLFTTLAVLVVLAIVIFSSAQDRLYSRTLAQTGRIHTMDSYLSNLEDDLPRAAYIAAFRSLIGMEEHISTNGTYITDFDAVFTSMFVNGTINGTFYGIMNDSTFTNFSQRFATITSQQGMRATLTVIAVNASQSNPWYIDLRATIRVELQDMAGTASFNNTLAIFTSVPVTDIKDPIYSVGTQGRSPHVIKQSSVSAPYILANNDTSALQVLVNQTFYIESAQAPSFIQRFTGNFSASPYGIQSLVNIEELEAQDIAIDTCKSVVVYLYFSNTSDTTYSIVNMDPSSFWLDDPHLADYDALGKVVATKCP